MPIILSVATLVFFLFALGDSHEAAIVTGSQVIGGLLFIPAAILAVVLVFYGAVRALSRDRAAYHAFVALLALPLTLLVGVRIASAHRKQHTRQVMFDWYAKADSLAAILLDYYHQHPERFHAQADSEEVSIDGFLAFFESHPDASHLAIGHDTTQLLDFAGRPFRYYIDRDRDGRMGKKGRSDAVDSRQVDQERVGVTDSAGAYLGIAPKPPAL